jgi:drug/metabolite transporter (DMT)-like permease
MNRKRIKILCFVLAILFGIFMFVYGEFDDSPGGQMLGLVAVVIGMVGIIKSKKKISN